MLNNKCCVYSSTSNEAKLYSDTNVSKVNIENMKKIKNKETKLKKKKEKRRRNKKKKK